MGGYFKSWRRKIGVATLVMACVFAAGWVRSISFREEIAISNRKDFVQRLMSFDHMLFWSQDRKYMPLFSWTAVPMTNLRPDVVMRQWGDTQSQKYAGTWGDLPLNIEWYWQWCGFAIGKRHPFLDRPSTIVVVPYWSVVIPLTLLSANLLLSKPRQRKVAVDQAEESTKLT